MPIHIGPIVENPIAGSSADGTAVWGLSNTGVGVVGQSQQPAPAPGVGHTGAGAVPLNDGVL
jgi:hypothetical protein